MLQRKEQDKSLKTDLNEIKISDLPSKEFKIMVTKMVTEIRRTTHEQSDNFNQYSEYIRKYQKEITELKSTITEIKKIIIIKGFNITLNPTEEKISELKIDQWNHPIRRAKRKEKKKNDSEDNLRELWDTIKLTNICIIVQQQQPKYGNNLNIHEWINE